MMSLPMNLAGGVANMASSTKNVSVNDAPEADMRRLTTLIRHPMGI